MRFPALATSATLVTACLVPLAGLAAPEITLQASFNGANGQALGAPLVAAGNGLYYGTSVVGGANSLGTLFAFDAASSSITLKDSFTGPNGANPKAALIAAGNGLYYGTAVSGAASNKGGIFAFDSATGSVILKDSFTGANGANSRAALIAVGNGIYYGTTEFGGANNNGVIFAFDAASGSISIKDSFNGANGASPYAALTAAGNGLYYGTTFSGGASDKGSIFAFDSTTGAITLKDSFSGANGAYPRAALTAAGDGLYYGTTEFGGANNKGAIFAFDATTGSITLKDSFSGLNGFQPWAELSAADNGVYFGTTLKGGARDKGAIFAFDSAVAAIILQASFDGSNGQNPTSALTDVGNGIFYGTTGTGGANNRGAIYAFDSGVRNPNPVPGPLPLVGIGAAFGWSRQLRRRGAQANPRRA
jgi:uncharacterized repeat protein (TIGR03803 family)